MNPHTFVKELSEIELKDVFNPYRHLCRTHDLQNGPVVRKKNLKLYLQVLEQLEVDTIWMGRDLGYRGGRRTGLALTDEYHLSHMCKTYPGVAVERATKGPALSERTASEIWSVLTKLSRPPLLWNVFPFHPHEFDNEFSNRKFSKIELDQVTGLNHQLISWLGIKRIICLGRDAASYATTFGIDVECVRHPSYGGVKEFREGMYKIYAEDLHGANLRSQLFE
jgi:hypothetical protein